MPQLIAFVGYENSYKYKYCQFLTSLGFQDLEFYKLTPETLSKLLFYKAQNKSICTCNLTTLQEYEILWDFCKKNDIKLSLYYCSTYHCNSIRTEGHDLVLNVESSMYPDLMDLQKIDLSILACSILGKQWAAKE